MKGVNDRFAGEAPELVRLCTFCYGRGVKCYSVSELNETARAVLSRAFDEETWVVGEVSGLKVHAKTGHMYFDLVEKSASMQGQYLAKIGCAFFRGAILAWQAQLKREGLQTLELRDGLEVKLKARVDLYVKEGRYQLIVVGIDPNYSLGAIARRRAQTIEALRAAGLLEKNKQRELNECPLAIGLITSYGSAAFNDFMSILNKSGYAFQVTLCDAHMQGARTGPEVVRALKALQVRDLDVIAIVRGGGAKTDLFYFDDLAICTAIAECPKPVISGIGHEIDLSVADMVAFRYFVTPTDTARFLVACLDACWARIDEAERQCAATSRQLLDRARERLHLNASRLAFSAQRHAVQTMNRLRSISHACTTRLLQGLSQEERHLVRLRQGITSASAFTLRAQAVQVSSHSAALATGTTSTLKNAGEMILANRQGLAEAVACTLSRAAEHLDTLHSYCTLMDPGEILKRGFSITIGKQGRALLGVEDVEKGDRLTTILAQGRIVSQVEEKERT